MAAPEFSDVVNRDAKYVSELVDPPKLAGLVVTQVQRVGHGQAMYFPVFRTGEFIAPYHADALTKTRDGKVLGASTSMAAWSVAKDHILWSADPFRGFCGVCISNTFIDSQDMVRNSAKRRKRDSRLSVAVAGTVTMRLWKGGSPLEPLIVPGNFVGFAAEHERSNYAILAGTESSSSVQIMPRIAAWTKERCDDGSVSAPFAVAVAVDYDTEEITVLLRKDLYHSYKYSDAVIAKMNAPGYFPTSEFIPKIPKSVKVPVDPADAP